MEYTFRCMSCDAERDLDYPMGEQPRLVRCPVTKCGGTAQQVIGAGVQIAPSALEAKGAEVRKSNRKERALAADMGSYKRMRRRGLQPERIDGASKIEDEVHDSFDVAYKSRLQGALKKAGVTEPWETTKTRVQEGLESVG
jgi:hypothetical protein